jgi:hypothetical protein
MTVVLPRSRSRKVEGAEEAPVQAEGVEEEVLRLVLEVVVPLSSVVCSLVAYRS